MSWENVGYFYASHSNQHEHIPAKITTLDKT